MGAKLSPKQDAFVREYLKDLNATQAAIRAKYSPKTAQEQSARLLSNVMVRAAIEKAQEKRNERLQVDADYVLRRLTEIDQLDIADILDGAGNALPIHEWPKAWRQSISGLDLQEMMTGDIATVIRKIKWPDKIRNIELLGKHINVNAFKEQIDVNVNVSLAERMAKARERASKA